MEHVAFILIIVFFVIVVPIFLILHYVTKWKSSKGLSEEEQMMLEDLWESGEQMRSRINALETILDRESPNWRNDS